MDLIKEPMCFDAALERYINRVHGTTRMTPFEISTNNKLVPNLIISIYNKKKLRKFQVGDHVRAPLKRTLYSKCYTTKWNR